MDTPIRLVVDTRNLIIVESSPLPPTDNHLYMSVWKNTPKGKRIIRVKSLEARAYADALGYVVNQSCISRELEETGIIIRYHATPFKSNPYRARVDVGYASKMIQDAICTPLFGDDNNVVARWDLRVMSGRNMVEIVVGSITMVQRCMIELMNGDAWRDDISIATLIRSLLDSPYDS